MTRIIIEQSEKNSSDVKRNDIEDKTNHQMKEYEKIEGCSEDKWIDIAI